MQVTHLDIARITVDAYSYNLYGQKEWIKVIDGLERRGYTFMQIVSILRSSWMRHFGNYTARSFLRDLDAERPNPHHERHVDELVEGTLLD